MGFPYEAHISPFVGSSSQALEEHMRNAEMTGKIAEGKALDLDEKKSLRFEFFCLVAFACYN